MTITVEDRPQAQLELLWLREAHGLDAAGEGFPPMLVDPPASAEDPVDDATRENWSAAWSRIWSDVVAHTAAEVDQTAFDGALGQEASPAEREIMLRRLIGPTWSDEFGAEAFDDDSYRDWQRRGVEAHAANMPTALMDNPEHRDVSALAGAWRRGLTKVVTIPCRGPHVRQVGSHALLVTDEVRADSAAYRAALDSFASRP